MKLRQVGQRIENVERAVEFYQKLLGKTPLAVFNPPGFAFFDMDGVRLFLDVNAPSALIYIQVEDVRESVRDLRSHGFEISTEPHVVFPDPDGIFDHPGDEWLAFIVDSEGNQVGLMSRN